MGYVLSFRKLKLTHNKPKNFEGRYYNRNPAINWSSFIPITGLPINYLEIGVSDGGNAIHISNSYCKNSASKIYCVDPWMDYDEYPENKGRQERGWITFNKNIQRSVNYSKFVVKRGLSGDIVPTFDNNFFDLIFVDGNHETKYVYDDGKMAFDKVKPGGYIVFDDYNLAWSQTMKGIDMFLAEHSTNIKIVSQHNNFWQVIIQKL
jgi:predicted O-methyltransferase YrrM